MPLKNDFDDHTPRFLTDTLKEKILFIIWFIILTSIHIWFQNANPSSQSEGLIGEMLVLNLVTFPIGFTIAIFPNEVETLTSFLHLKVGLSESNSIWLLFVILGFLQWYVIVPKIISYWKKRSR